MIDRQEKRCPRCEETKPRAEFYASRERPDGLDTYCRPCSRTKRRERYSAGGNDRERAEYYENHAEKRAACKRSYERHREARLEHGREYRAKFPQRDMARSMARAAIKAGALERGPCEECGTDSDIHAHHDDYAQPLVVRWLCPKHHNRHHRAILDPEREP